MIRAILELLTGLMERCGIPLRRLCPAVGISRSSVTRWRNRVGGSGPLLQRPGPRKMTTADITAVTQDVKDLGHNRHRSHGTAALYQKYCGSISRRDLDEMIDTARAEANHEHRAQMRRITWNASGVAWSMDDTGYDRPDAGGHTPMLHHLEDLGSKYKFPPLCGALALGEEVAGNLRHHFIVNGAPLFTKRDGGGNLNHVEVDQVLAEYAVLPLNSPFRYPPYNGAIEEAQGELKTGLKNQISGVEWRQSDNLEPYARAAVHEINHRPRPCLGGKTACQVFFNNRVVFSKPERKAIYGWIIERRNHIINGGNAVSRETAWRIAAEQWLVMNGFITISINNQVLPNFQERWHH